ncbi:unnamed protein product [Phytophthora fragariaefolia]|uniref:Unnamed protein product n=1 Tax=Phytophthora fragariaefolia TaxID=1490495 RepID=A0A9W7CXQ0_9STRA|nr:unnamed protein product [Phytophthora fragariaefolia]
MSTPTTQTAGTPAASAAANTVVTSSATTGCSPASTSVVTSTVTTPSSPKRTMSLGDYKKTRSNALFARDELEALFDVGSDADMENEEEMTREPRLQHVWTRVWDPVVLVRTTRTLRARSARAEAAIDRSMMLDRCPAREVEATHFVQYCCVAHWSSARPMDADSKRDPISLRQHCSAESVRIVLVQWRH